MGGATSNFEIYFTAVVKIPIKVFFFLSFFPCLSNVRGEREKKRIFLSVLIILHASEHTLSLFIMSMRECKQSHCYGGGRKRQALNSSYYDKERRKEEKAVFQKKNRLKGRKKIAGEQR